MNEKTDGQMKWNRCENAFSLRGGVAGNFLAQQTAAKLIRKRLRPLTLPQLPWAASAVPLCDQRGLMRNLKIYGQRVVKVPASGEEGATKGGGIVWGPASQTIKRSVAVLPMNSSLNK